MHQNDIRRLIGKKIVAYRGFLKPSYNNNIELQFILFDDEETYIEFRDQDGYDYHDYNRLAKLISFSTDKKLWRQMFDKEGYVEPTDYRIWGFW